MLRHECVFAGAIRDIGKERVVRDMFLLTTPLLCIARDERDDGMDTVRRKHDGSSEHLRRGPWKRERAMRLEY